MGKKWMKHINAERVETVSLLQEKKMDKSVFSVARLEDDSDEAAYWQTQTPRARWEALELMRQVMYGYDPSTTRLERVFETASLKRG